DPGSAALQRDLSVSYWKLASLSDPEFPWSRVVTKLEEMESAGTLFPVDRRFLIQARIRASKERNGAVNTGPVSRSTTQNLAEEGETQ
ncbi:hypothetical protein, partial [Novosphingobium beihaiensis]